MKTLAFKWGEYKTLCIPPAAPAIQLIEMRRSFYNGAYCVLSSLMELGKGEDQPDGAIVELLDGFLAELKQFKKDLTDGIA